MKLPDMPRRMRDLLQAAQSHLRAGASTDERTAIRRAARTSDWQHDPERMAAADAKRIRRRARAGGASS